MNKTVEEKSRVYPYRCTGCRSSYVAVDDDRARSGEPVASGGVSEVGPIPGGKRVLLRIEGETP
jgi:hypothetical protein